MKCHRYIEYWWYPVLGINYQWVGILKFFLVISAKKSSVGWHTKATEKNLKKFVDISENITYFSAIFLWPILPAKGSIFILFLRPSPPTELNFQFVLGPGPQSLNFNLKLPRLEPTRKAWVQVCLPLDNLLF